ncbi:MAG: hypothetical protein ACTS22_01230 [Phycisphaerales bacterium]
MCALALAASGFGATSAIAGAGDHRGERWHDRTRSRSDGGWLVINGHRCAFEVRGSVERSLVRALRDAGYDAWLSRGCVVIEGRRIRFSAELPGYRFVVSRRGHRTVVRVEACEAYGGWRGGRYDRWDRGRGWDPWDDCRPRRVHRPPPRYGCGIGFGFRIGDGRVTVRLPLE